MHPLASLPSPSRSVWHLGPIPVRAYALCIVVGIFVALALTLRRWRARDGRDDDVWDIAGWAIVFGIIGGRLYHVITDPELYFDRGRHPIDAFKIWDGGLGIWGAIALGTFGAWIGCRRKGVALLAFADVAIPGVVFAQGIGRWGNWFNNELYGGPTSLPWGLRVHCMNVSSGRAVPFGTADGGQVCNGSAVVHGLFQPTFLYESLWDIALGVGLLVIDRQVRMRRGNLFALYVMGYTAGRGWIEALRHDPAHHFVGLRLNDWTALILFVAALVWFVRHGAFARVPEPVELYTRPRPPDADSDGEEVSVGAPPEDAEGGPGADGRPDD